MPTRQNHGLIFQHLFESHLGFSTVVGRTDFIKDPVTGLPVHFKSQKIGTPSVAMSSLQNFLRSMELGQPPFTLGVLDYEQVVDSKVGKIYTEYFINPDEHRKAIVGNFTLEHANDFHKKISIAQEPDPDYARIVAKGEQAKYKLQLGLLFINPKIDSEHQRRLQCSLKISKLKTIVDWQEHKGFYRKVRLFEIED